MLLSQYLHDEIALADDGDDSCCQVQLGHFGATSDDNMAPGIENESLIRGQRRVDGLQQLMLARTENASHRLRTTVLRCRDTGAGRRLHELGKFRRASGRQRKSA